MLCKIERSNQILARLTRINAIYANYPPGTWAIHMTPAEHDEIVRLDAELQALFAQKEAVA